MFGLSSAICACVCAQASYEQERAARIERERRERELLASMTHEERMEHFAKKQVDATNRLARATEDQARSNREIAANSYRKGHGFGSGIIAGLIVGNVID